MQDTSLNTHLRLKFEKEFFPNGVTSEQIKLIDGIEKLIGEAFRAGYKMGTQIGAEEWSNNACLGYAIVGAKRLEYPDKKIQELVSAIRGEFDWKTIGEAEQAYNKSTY